MEPVFLYRPKLITAVGITPYLGLCLALLLITLPLIDNLYNKKSKLSKFELIEVVVGRSGTLEIKAQDYIEEINLESLIEALNRAKNTLSFDEINIIVSADKAVNYGKITHVIDVLQRYGIKKVGLKVENNTNNNEKDTALQIPSEKKSNISVEYAKSIFKDLLLLEPLKCLITIMDTKETIICIADKGVQKNEIGSNVFSYKLTKFANSWRLESSKKIFESDYSKFYLHSEIEIAEIDGQIYLYFISQAAGMGNATYSISVDFSLFPLKNGQLLSLTYMGDPTYDKNGKLLKIRGDFYNIDKLNKHPNLLKFLEKKASNSEYIYRANSKDLDFSSTENYEKLWKIDNPNISTVWDSKDNFYNKPLKFKYYEQTILPIHDFSKNEGADNKKYKIISMWRGNIIGYDKLEKKYFPIWVESCMRGCNKKVQFLSSGEGQLKVTYDEVYPNLSLLIDLDRGSYSILVK